MGEACGMYGGENAYKVFVVKTEGARTLGL